MSRNPPPRDFRKTFMNALGLRASGYNPQNIRSPNAISPPIAIDPKLIQKRKEVDPNYYSIETDKDYSKIQNSIRGLADEVLRFDDLEPPSNKIINPRTDKSIQYLEM